MAQTPRKLKKSFLIPQLASAESGVVGPGCLAEATVFACGEGMATPGHWQVPVSLSQEDREGQPRYVRLPASPRHWVRGNCGQLSLPSCPLPARVRAHGVARRRGTTLPPVPCAAAAWLPFPLNLTSAPPQRAGAFAQYSTVAGGAGVRGTVIESVVGWLKDLSLRNSCWVVVRWFGDEEPSRDGRA